jgi:hypothetical protein
MIAANDKDTLKQGAADLFTYAFKVLAIFLIAIFFGLAGIMLAFYGASRASAASSSAGQAYVAPNITETITATLPALTSTRTSTSTRTPTITRTPSVTPPPVETCGVNSNYIVTQSTGEIVPGTEDLHINCRGCTGLIDLPFSFSLYGQEFSSARVSSSGNVQFSSNNAQYVNQCLPRANFNNTIWVSWENYLDTTRRDECPTCGVYSSVSGEAPNRIFNIEWRGRAGWPLLPVNFELRLYEDQNRFDMVYGQMDRGGSESVVGVQRDTGSRYTQFQCNTGGLTPGLALSFTQPVCPTATGTPPTATITRTPTVTRSPTAVCGTESNYVVIESLSNFVAATHDIGNYCDDCTTQVTLPFTYTLYGQSYNTAMVSSNGTLQFTGNSPASQNTCLPSTALSDTIMAYWTDLTTEASGSCIQCGVFTSTTGTAPNRVFTVEWRANTVTTPPTYTNFEVRLYEGQNTFDLLYGDMNAQYANYTTGVQRGNGSMYRQYACQDPRIRYGTLLTFSQPSCSMTTTPTRTPTGTPPTATPTSPPVATCGVNANYNLFQTTGQIVPGTVDTGNHCDGCTTAITLPFTYNFYGQPFTSARVSSYGHLQFSSNIQNDITNTCIPNSNYNNTIFALWSWMHTANTTGCPECGIFTSVSGSAPNRIFNIEWRTVMGNGYDRAHFEIRLHEANGRFDLVYGEIGENGSVGGRASVVGAQRGTGSHFTQYICRPYAPVIEPNLMLIFEQPPCESPTPTATVTPGGPTVTPTPCGMNGNYTYSQSTAPIVPGTSDVGIHCDDCYTNIQIPFPYSLYGQTFNRANVSSNGALQFNSNSTEWNNTCMPATGFYNTVFAYWDDLRTDSVLTATVPTGVFTSVIGLAPNRIFNIEWRACVRPESGEVCADTDTNFEVRLYEGQTSFDVVYGQVADSGSGATIGVQRGALGGNTRYTQYSCDSGGITPGLALTFSLPCGTPQAPLATPTSGAFGYILGPGRVPAENLRSPFSVDLLIHGGAGAVVAAQNYLTFPSDMVRVVDPTTRSCDEVAAISEDTTVFDRVLQNEVCNGPVPCLFRGNLAPPGSIAFASAAYANPPARGDFHVARIAFCGERTGTITLRWEFSPQAPPHRNSAVLGQGNTLADNRALYSDFAFEIGGSGTPVATSTSVATAPISTAIATSTATIHTATRTAMSTATGTATAPISTAVGTHTPTRTATAIATAVGTHTPTRMPTSLSTSTPALTALPTNTPGSVPVTFSDVNTSDYFYSAVQYLAGNRVISGYADGTFRPYNNATRGQLSKIVVLAEGWPIQVSDGPHFRDVAPDSTFYPYIETAYSRGIISGYDCGAGCAEFRPGANVTRAQLCKIIVGARGWDINVTGGPHFRDVPETDTFYGYIETAFNHNLISGYDCGTGCAEFRPGNSATRGQIAKIVYNAVTQP